MPAFRGKPIDHVIDVRSTLEFWLGHLEGATLMPVGDLPEVLEARTDIPKHARLLVYCASGGRSAQAAQVLRAAGYSNVVDGGGMAAARAEFTP